MVAWELFRNVCTRKSIAIYCLGIALVVIVVGEVGFLADVASLAVFGEVIAFDCW